MFVVIQAHNCPAHLYGYLTRFMLEIDSNLFVAKMSNRVAEHLWERISNSEDKEVSFIMIKSSNKEQGYDLQIHGGEKIIIEMDGFYSIGRKNSPE